MSPSEILPAVKALHSRRDDHLGREGDAPELRSLVTGRRCLWARTTSRTSSFEIAQHKP
jgi:hypothetical protein